MRSSRLPSSLLAGVAGDMGTFAKRGTLVRVRAASGLARRRPVTLTRKGASPDFQNRAGVVSRMLFLHRDECCDECCTW